MRCTSLPNIEDFKEEAKLLRKNDPSITKHTMALNILAVQYGHENWRALRPMLVSKVDFNEEENDSQPYIELLCGISHSGKSTYVKNRYTGGFDGVVLSRDKLVMKYGKGSTYNECWDSLTKEMQRIIDSELEEQYDRAIELRLNVVIDLMNITKRQRSRWLVDLPEDYKKRARVFKVPFTIISKRNEMLFDEKFIPEHRLRDMLNRFEIPSIGEFDEVL